MDLQDLSAKQLLQMQASIINELKTRSIVRTNNNPLGDYTEFIVSKCLGLELTENSKAGYDAIGKDQVRYQIKGRRNTPGNSSRQLSAIRNYEKNNFDQLVAVIFDENYDVLEALVIPHGVIEDYASYRVHVNGHILHIRDAIIRDERVRDIKSELLEMSFH